MPELRSTLDDVQHFPLTHALFGRRARRFGLGMEIPSGPLAFKSTKPPSPLADEETQLLVAAGVGVSGWSFGVPFGPRTPDSHAEFTLRFTGRPAPTAAGLGTPALFYTNDNGCFCVRTRDVRPRRNLESDGEADSLKDMLGVCRDATTKIADDRLDVPSTPPYILPPNLWWANKPGSTLFMPVGDASEECLGLMALMIRHGVTVIDQDTGRPAGKLERFFRSGLLDEQKALPLAELLSDVHESICMELAMIGHNMVLMLQALGLGGLFFSGMDAPTVLGASADAGIRGLGFRSISDDRWPVPNVVGLDSVYEGLCPPFYSDMRAAVEKFVERKFGAEGAYRHDTPGPWRRSADVKRTVEPYSDEFIDCLTEVAQYIHDKYGKFPGNRSTIVSSCYVQAHHIDTDFYDKFYGEGAYLPTHARHAEHWHEV